MAGTGPPRITAETCLQLRCSPLLACTARLHCIAGSLANTHHGKHSLLAPHPPQREIPKCDRIQPHALATLLRSKQMRSTAPPASPPPLFLLPGKQPSPLLVGPPKSASSLKTWLGAHHPRATREDHRQNQQRMMCHPKTPKWARQCGGRDPKARGGPEFKDGGNTNSKPTANEQLQTANSQNRKPRPWTNKP